MDELFRKDIFHKLQYCYFFVSWLFGLLFGIWFANAFSDNFSSLMRGMLNASVSIVGLLVVVLFPLLISVFCLFSYRPLIFLLLSFAEALSFGFIGSLIMMNVSSGRWFILLLIFVPNLPIYAMLIHRWYSMITYKQRSMWTECYTSAIVGIIVVGIHYLVISPLLEGLF